MIWIESKGFDYAWIIGPAFISTFFVFIFNFLGIAPQTTSTLYWLIFVVFIDVGHVWSTLFRTYLHKEGRVKFKKQLWLIPIGSYMIGVLLYSQGALVFWRVLAYLAVFHFIRQQYGIYQIYAHKEISSSESKQFESLWLNKLTIYSATLIPLIIWHLGSEREMNWFVAGDFLYFEKSHLIPLFYGIAVVILLCYGIKEIIIQKKSLFLPKNLFLVGTLFAWWSGIVFYQSDWSFTITNVVAHGIPYYALIYVSHLKKREQLTWPTSLPLFSIFFLLLFLGYFEEALWDAFIWREHSFLFGFFSFLPKVQSLEMATILVPCLTLPQATHYVLDGLIWKRES